MVLSKMRRVRLGALDALSRIAVSALVAAAGLAGPATARQAPTPPDVLITSPTGVSMTDTTFTYATEDLSIGPFKLERSFYGAADTSKNYFGGGWTHNFDMWGYSMVIGALGMNPSETTKIVIGRKTYAFYSVARVNPSNDGGPENGNEGYRVEIQNNVYLFTDRDGVKYRFDSQSGDARVVSVTSPDGGVLTLSYASKRLRTVFSNRGYALVFDYDGAGNVKTACGFNRAVTYVTTSTTCASATIKTSYGYTSGKLTSATSLTGDVATYQYNGWGGALSCVTDPGSSTCKYTIEYTPGTNEVSKQTLADGSVWSFSCSCVYVRGQGEPFQDDSTGWVDPLNGERNFFLTDGVIKWSSDETGRQYEPGFYGGNLVGLLMPEKNRWFVNLSPRGIVSGNVYRPTKTGVSGYPDIVQDAKTFPAGDCTNRATCNKPLTIADGNNNLTSFTYDQTHGGVLTETRPANSDNVQAVIRHAYVQRTAWVKNASGGYSAQPAIWLASEDRTCRTTATVNDACTGGAADEVVTTYDYGPDSGPNTLLLRGMAVTADGVTLRTCYAYDEQGNRISETSPRAGLASCS